MAKVVLGLGCSHSPQLHTPADQWDIRARRDAEDALPLWYQGERLTYAEVLDKRRHQDLGSQTTIRIREERLRRAHAAIGRLSDMFARTRPDVTVIFGNDQHEIFPDSPESRFTIMGAPEFVNMPRTEEQAGRLPPGIALADQGHLPEGETVRLPGHPALARHIADQLAADSVDANFAPEQIRADSACAQTSGMPHAYGFIYKQLMRSSITPHVPIDTNTLSPSIVPSASECLDFGRRVGEAIRNWKDDARVCVIASGGLSHFVVDEDFDRKILAAMTANDFEALCDYSDGYYQAGSAEIRSWIAAGGAMAGFGLQGRLVGYEALYRTPAGTGSSAAFASWS